MTNISPQDYQSWLNQLKTDIRTAQQRSVLAVNQELIKLYWRIGKDILQLPQAVSWGILAEDNQQIRELFNIEPEALTFNESNYLIGFRSTDEIRNRRIKAEKERNLRLHAKGIT